MPAPGKKRYQITLTQSTVEEFQSLAESMNMPQGTMSSVLDDSLKSITATIRKLKAKGDQATFGDFFQIVGQQLNEMEKEVADDKEAAQGGKSKKG